MFVNLPKRRAIPANGEIVLVKQSLKHLMDQNYSNEEALAILEDWQKQKSGILVYVEYEDIYGNKMEPLRETLN